MLEDKRMMIEEDGNLLFFPVSLSRFFPLDVAIPCLLGERKAASRMVREDYF